MANSLGIGQNELFNGRDVDFQQVSPDKVRSLSKPRNLLQLARVERGAMDIDQRKEQFSHAYVKAVAAVAGFAWYKPSVDDDSIDLGLAQTGGGGTTRSPRLEVQLKCKAFATPNEPDFSHSIKLKNYDDLRDTNVLVPRMLVVVLVPDDPREWLVHSEAELAIRRCGYWLSLHGLPASDNQSSQTVQMIRSQTFSVDALQGIMERIGNGRLP